MATVFYYNIDFVRMYSGKCLIKTEIYQGMTGIILSKVISFYHVKMKEAERNEKYRPEYWRILRRGTVGDGGAKIWCKEKEKKVFVYFDGKEPDVFCRMFWKWFVFV